MPGDILMVKAVVARLGGARFVHEVQPGWM